MARMAPRLLILSFLLHGTLLAQASSASVGSPTASSTAQADAIRNFYVGQNPMVAWERANPILRSASSEQRRTILEQLITDRNQRLASDAATWAIDNRETELADTIASQIGAWSAVQEAGVIGAVVFHPAGFLEVPRSLIRESHDA